MIFSEEDTKRHEKEFRDIIYPEEWLDVYIKALMYRSGYVADLTFTITKLCMDIETDTVKMTIIAATIFRKEQFCSNICNGCFRI